MQRNPYVILGIPFGSSREQANIAFARRSRSLRRAGDAGRGKLTDLTWALNQIDEAISTPEVALEIYRIPAEQTAFEGGPGVFSPPPEVLPARPGDRDAAFHSMHQAAAHEYLRYLTAKRAPRLGLPEA
jgi:hypothetical protein